MIGPIRLEGNNQMQTRQLWTILVVDFIDMLGFSLIVPIIPFYAEQFGASPFMVGLLVASYAAAQVLVAQAYIADITDTPNRARGLGMMGAAFGIGFVIGPLVGGALSVFGYGVPALVAGGLSVVNLIAAFAFLTESL